MYKRVRIQNFRGLRDLTIDDLGRVNLIVGENGAGKTSLLEALYLFQGAGSPALTFPLAITRGFQFVPQTADLVWHLLFPDASADRPIEIEALAEDGKQTALRITLNREPIEQFLSNGGHADSSAIGRISPHSCAVNARELGAASLALAPLTRTPAKGLATR